MGPSVYDEGIGFVVIEELYHIYMGTSSVDVEYSVLACKFNYSLRCIYWYG